MSNRAEILFHPIFTQMEAVWIDSEAKDESTFEAFITAIGATVTTVMINVTESIVADLTIPANITLVFTPNGSLSIAVTKNVIIQTKDIFAGNYQIFSGDGDFDFVDDVILKPIWFSSFEVGITTIGSIETVTYLIDQAYSITDDETIPANVILEFVGNGELSIATAKTLTFDTTSINAGKNVILSGAGSFSFISGTKLHSSWFSTFGAGLDYIGISTQVEYTIDTSITISANENIPANVTLVQPDGVVFSDDGNDATLTIEGLLKADKHQYLFNWTNAGTVVVSSASTIYPEWWGATRNGVTDAGLAIKKACIALQANEGGTLLFSAGTYYLYDDGIVAYSGLGSFTSLTGVNLISEGATLAMKDQSWGAFNGDFFTFDDCHSIVINGFTTTGPTGANVVPCSLFGLGFVRFVSTTAGCTDISMPQNILQGLVYGVNALRTVGDPDSKHLKNLNIGNLIVTDATYGINMQNTGINITVDLLKTDNVCRSYFAYGEMYNHKIVVDSKDNIAADINIGTNDGEGFEKFDITYLSDATTVGPIDSRVHIGFGDQTAATIQDVKINLGVTYPVAGDTGSFALELIKLDDGGSDDTTGSRGHVWNGLEVTGYILGTPSIGANSLRCFGIANMTGEVITNFSFKNFYSDESIIMQMANLTDNISFENVTLAAGKTIDVRDYAGAYPGAGKISFFNCSFANQYDTVGGIPPANYLRSGVTPQALVVGHMNGRVITNAAMGGAQEYDIPAALVGMKATFVAAVDLDITIDPNGTDTIGYGAAGEALILATARAWATIECFVDGAWTIVGSSPDLTYETNTLTTLTDSAAPSVAGNNRWLTGATTTITNFTGGYVGQIIYIVSEHSITLTNGADIVLNASVDYVMADEDTLTLIQKADGNWYELARSENT